MNTNEQKQGLAITTEPHDRAALLDRASVAAAAAATADAQRFADEAIAIHEQLGDGLAVNRALVRLGRVLLDASELDPATQVLERALREAEALGEDEALATALAHLSRVYMRNGHPEDSVGAADRSLSIAERLNLEPIVAEALQNKAASLGILGRRRESIALPRLSLEMVVRLGMRSDEMRARNNLASALFDDDPAAATRGILEALELAQKISRHRRRRASGSLQLLHSLSPGSRMKRCRMRANWFFLSSSQPSLQAWALEPMSPTCTTNSSGCAFISSISRSRRSTSSSL